MNTVPESILNKRGMKGSDSRLQKYNDKSKEILTEMK